MKTEPIESLNIKRANIVDKYLPPIDQQRYYQRLEMHEELIDLINSHSPKIKQLEWENHGSSITAVGLSDYEYCVNLKDDHTALSLRNNSQIIVLGPYSRPDEAKAAAQRDFEKRVKECLE